MGFQINCKRLKWNLKAVVPILLRMLRRKDPKQEEHGSEQAGMESSSVTSRREYVSFTCAGEAAA